MVHVGYAEIGHVKDFFKLNKYLTMFANKLKRPDTGKPFYEYENY
jgi:hypothetical protein